LRGEEPTASTARSGGTERPIARVLSGIARILESDQDVDARIRHVLEEVQHVIPYDHCALLSSGVNGGETLTVAPPAEPHELDHLRSMLKRLRDLLREGSTLDEATSWGELSSLEEWRSRLAVPLVGLDEVVGVLAVGCDAPDAYDEHDLQLLSIVAAQIAAYLTALRARMQEHRYEQAARGHAEDEKRRLEVFLAMLSHELRNPLAPIRNAVELLRLGEDDSFPKQEMLSAIDRQVATLTRLVDDLLDVSRVTTGRIQLQHADVDLNALVQQVVDAVGPLFTSRQQELSLSLADSALWVHGDPTRLEQVVVNLLSNAAKYTPEGGRAWLALAEEAGKAVVRVRDSGVGMGPDLLPHVFELFTQGERALDRAQGGLGLGLALVRSLVAMHGGTITATSEGIGRGSEFVVRLPVLSPVDNQQRPPRSVSTETEAQAGKGTRVLVVDDNPDAANLMATLLRTKGWEAQTALDGPGALQAAISFRPGLVLLDIGLPRMNGYEVAQRIRQEEALRGIVLIAVTGYGQAEDLRRAREAGFDHHLVKPVDFATLEGILESASEAWKAK
jgi:signal transduction histidine kinase/ActR/RegA family two-component response regulator